MTTAQADRPRPAPQPAGPGSDRAVERVLGIEVCVRAILAERPMEIGSILGMTQGTIIEFERAFDHEIDLEVSGCPVATGHVVKVGENFGVRVTRVRSVEDRIHAMGPR